MGQLWAKVGGVLLWAVAVGLVGVVGLVGLGRKNRNGWNGWGNEKLYHNL
ncbi:hypothetical protein [Moraxella sp. ZY200743]